MKQALLEKICSAQTGTKKISTAGFETDTG